MPRDTPHNTRDYLTNLVIRGILGTARLVPYRWRVPLGGWVVSRLVAPIAGYTKRVRENLNYVLPNLPEAEVTRLTRAVPDNVGRALIEMYAGPEFTARFANAPVDGPGLKALEDARDAGQPVLLITGHFGNYDAPRAALIAKGFQIGGLYREMNNAYFNPHYVNAMASIGTPIFPRGRKGLAGMIKYLRGGGMLGMLIDQYMRDGADLTFFGKPAPTALSAAELALKYKAVMIPIYGIRQPNGLDFHMIAEAPIEHTNARDMTQKLNDSLEAHARAHLEQWFWIHRRWKPERAAQRKRAAAKIGPDTPS